MNLRISSAAARLTWILTGRGRSKKADIEPDNMCQESANRNNKYFATVGAKIQEELNFKRPPEVHEKTQNKKPSFSFKKENPKKIQKIIEGIRNEVAIGCDNIGIKIIKDLKDILVPLLTELINIGYETSKFPDCMKMGIIKPIFKKDDRNEISNYRPITILPTLSKVFERAATDQIVQFLEQNKLISKKQHAYRKGHSTNTCLMDSTNYIYKMVDQNKYVALLSLDLSKAFDSIDHQLLLQKMKMLGLQQCAVDWIASYLTNRKQRTKFQEFLSDEETVIAGIPQGSILGPLLFTCFTNDMSNNFENICKMIAYADDTQLLVTADSEVELKASVHLALKTAQAWYSSNSMKNNVDKSDLIVFSPRAINENIEINTGMKNEKGKDIILKTKKHIKILGIYIDQNLNWTKQVNQVKRSAMNATRTVHKINHFLPLTLKKVLYNCIICPQFSYVDIIWDGCNQQQAQSLQRVQNFAAKSMTGKRKYDSASQALKQLNLLNLKQRREIHAATQMHKIINSQTPENLYAEYQQQLPNSHTRYAEQGNYIIPTHSTSMYKRSTLYRSIIAYNSAPNKDTHDSKTFKNRLQQHMLKETYR